MEARKQESEVRSLVQRATDELVVAVLADKKTEERKNLNNWSLVIGKLVIIHNCHPTGW